VARDWRAAIDTALERAVQALLRTRQRRRHAPPRQRLGRALAGAGAS